ncbi:hypothetical protein FUAX_08810 [Fulvitalea axinellae]|uniref:Uncharacterized protein n=1 Tax=Fulvitalea axinellae TaxID=1182444 RepID=A0AAU9D200_9BACT|nr:hypothetical protein FUAX_08810 [Fulvitalea axinellae]
MAKLKSIIKQLTNNDFNAIYESLIDSNAEKSAYLLKSMRERQLSDHRIMQELGVNTNAYYTLRSRLKQKIEEYLLQQMENPRTDIIKKVANIIEIIFTKKKAIAVATIKKLEKELIDYDLSNELTIIYKSLKKLHVNSPDYFHYSQQYNKHIAFMLAVDKAEDMLAEYFKKYGQYALTGNDREKLELTLIVKEMNNLLGMYDSHRLYVYHSCVSIFHRLFIERDEDSSSQDNREPVEDTLAQVDNILESYNLDTIYYHLRLVFEYLKLEYYDHYKVYRKAEKYYEEVNDYTAVLLSNYSLFTYPPQFLITKLERALRTGTEANLYGENQHIFDGYDPDTEDTPKFVSYVTYRALCCYYAGHYDEAAKWVNNLLNEVSLKKTPYALLEVKAILALQYCLMNDFDLFNQLVNSIQRQIRILGKDVCERILMFTKILKISISDSKRQKAMKIRSLIEKMPENTPTVFAPTKLVKMDDSFVDKLSKPELHPTL